jgi:hypothetical protein
MEFGILNSQSNVHLFDVAIADCADSLELSSNLKVVSHPHQHRNHDP